MPQTAPPKSDNATAPESIRGYLNEIAERLWSGHASVMVGSGFSKNVERGNETDKGFPSWNQLGDAFYTKLHGRDPEPDTSRYMNPIKLAEEVEAAYGRPALNQLLLDEIPDKEFDPSPLHVKLLELPWSDVFTTNYDSLLERATDSITSRRYDIVMNTSDLVYSSPPRIIKLHGSFPSTKPFIISEEDYRSYPHKFAPFINTVQQNLLEDTFCIIGFSGDDPNFLQWIGWIHDNLGIENSPKMYLVGVFHLQEAQKKLLEKRNITLVNLADFDGVDGDHYAGLEAFLSYIESRNQKGKLDWPDSPKQLSPQSEEDLAPQLVQTLKVWRAERQSYPGWIILPKERREILWLYTSGWTRTYDLDLFSGTHDLEWAYELTWRLEKCLIPLQNYQIPFLESVVDKYAFILSPESTWSNKPIASAPNEADDESIEISAQEEPSSNVPFTTLCDSELSLAQLRSQYLDIVIRLLRSYREDGASGKWKATDKTLSDHLQHLSGEQRAYYYYERVMEAMFRQDVSSTKTRLEVWPSDDALPMWEAKRAGLLAETGCSGPQFFRHSFALIRPPRRPWRSALS